MREQRSALALAAEAWSDDDLRTLDLRKSPSISETLDWAKALVTLNSKTLDKATLDNTLNVLLKHESDLNKVKRRMQQGSGSPGNELDDDENDMKQMRWRG